MQGMLSIDAHVSFSRKQHNIRVKYIAVTSHAKNLCFAITKDGRIQRKMEVGRKVRREENSAERKIVFGKKKHTIIRKFLRLDL